MLVMYRLRARCSFTLVLWEADLEDKNVYESFSDALRPLVEIWYVVVHLADAMEHWSS